MPTGIGTAMAIVGAASSVAGTVMGAVGTGYGLNEQLGGIDKATQGARDSATAQKEIVQQQQQQEAVRMQAMQMDAKRKQVENLRQVQQARALSVATANNQGALIGNSSLQGGLAQVSSAGGWNALGIKQGLSFGQQMFDINAQMTQSKLRYADAQAMVAEGQGQASMGAAIMSGSQAAGNIAKNIGGNLTTLGQGWGKSSSPSAGWSSGQYTLGNLGGIY